MTIWPGRASVSTRSYQVNSWRRFSSRSPAWRCSSSAVAPRPKHCHRHHLDGEGRVLRASELEIGEGPRTRDHDDQEQGDRALADAQGREVEAAHRAAVSSGATETSTFSPGFRRCAPSGNDTIPPAPGLQ